MEEKNEQKRQPYIKRRKEIIISEMPEEEKAPLLESETNNLESIPTDLSENSELTIPFNKTKKEFFSKNKKNEQFVQVIPLGGLGEIGRNMMAVEFQREIIIIDCGVMFPDNDYLGVDLILPDFSYVKSRRKNVRAILITHGHEDHIGGVPFLMKELPGVPIFAPKMAMELIIGKLKEHKLNYDKQKLNLIQKNKKINLSPSFAAEFVEVNHSIRDSFAIALYTPIGTIVHSGDFKIEFNSVGDSEFDFHKFADLGQKGVLLLCSDSTNVEKKSEEKTEQEVLKNLASLIEHAKGRVIISTFASNVTRVAKIAEIAANINKRVVLIGRNMENNFEISKKLGYFHVANSSIVKPQNAKNYPDNNLVIITTGTQGETLSALTRISNDSHKFIKLKQTDTIIISASVIPGNEKSVSKVIDSLYEKGVQVHYSKNASVHVSGHGASDNLLLMLRLIKPKFFLPVHGERRHLILHSKLAESIGIPSMNTVVSHNGEALHLSKSQFKLNHRIPLETLLVENLAAGDYSEIINDRKAMSQDGLILTVVTLSKYPGGMDFSADIITKGFIRDPEEKEFIKRATKTIENILSNEKNIEDSIGSLSGKIKKALEMTIHSFYNKKPLLEIRLIEIEK